MTRWIEDRASWRIPLLGSAEVNRFRAPARRLFYSQPYPVMAAADMGVGMETTFMFPLELKNPSAAQNMGMALEFFSMSESTQPKEPVKYEHKIPSEYNMGMGLDFLRMSDKTGQVSYTARDPSMFNMGMGAHSINIARVLLGYVHPVPDNYDMGMALQGVTIK